jgi:hypothetical protein
VIASAPADTAIRRAKRDRHPFGHHSPPPSSRLINSIEQPGGGTRLENHQFGSDQVNLTNIKALTGFAAQN